MSCRSDKVSRKTMTPTVYSNKFKLTIATIVFRITTKYFPAAFLPFAVDNTVSQCRADSQSLCTSPEVSSAQYSICSHAWQFLHRNIFQTGALVKLLQLRQFIEKLENLLSAFLTWAALRLGSERSATHICGFLNTFQTTLSDYITWPTLIDLWPLIKITHCPHCIYVSTYVYTYVCYIS